MLTLSVGSTLCIVLPGAPTVLGIASADSCMWTTFKKDCIIQHWLFYFPQLVGDCMVIQGASMLPHISISSAYVEFLCLCVFSEEHACNWTAYAVYRICPTFPWETL